jgi:ABC-2 type transport system permease protein
LPLRILGASAVLMLPTAALALALSSLTAESRYATFAWFGIWAVGWVAYAIVNASFPPGSRTVAQAALVERVTLVSLYHTLGHVQNWVFGLEASFAKVSAAVIEAATITVISLVILFRRVSSPMRI